MICESFSVFDLKRLAVAGAERFELPSTVLETAILPLNYAPKLGAVLPAPVIVFENYSRTFKI